MHDRERREVLVAGAGLLLVLWPALAAGKKPKKEELEVSPGEDLMREHGVLNRVLLIYEEISRRLDAGQ